MIKRKSVIAVLSILAFCLSMSSCAMVQKSNVQQTENLLTAAGFKMYAADTPEKLAHLQTKPQHEMIMHEKNGKIFYTYADAEYSKTMYVGDVKAYQKYQKMRFEKNLAAQKAQTAEELDEMQSWYMFGPGF